MGDLAPIRDEELLLRWAEYSAFTPVMRTHETNLPAENVQVYDTPEILSKFGRLTQVYSKLKPYIQNAVRQNTNEGIPVMRPLFLQFQDDKNVYEQNYQYMFGDDLLIAPVLQPGVSTWEVYLPGPEDWIWLWEKSLKQRGGFQTVTVDAPMGYTPVFYRATSQYKEIFMEIAQMYG